MKALFIGGTGTISTAIVKRLTEELGWQVWLLNRGNRKHVVPYGVHQITADINNEEEVSRKIKGLTFDVVCEFIGFRLSDVERDYRLFKGRTRQYIFTSSASAYHKPAAGYIITEGTTLANPHWQYSRDKIACEEFLLRKYREEGFPVTIVRPSHTYDERNIPTGLHGKKNSWQVIRRMQEGRPVIIHGDGSSLWTLTFNRDFAIGYTGLMGNRRAIGEAFQITGDETLTWNQIYATIADALGVRLNACHVSSDFLAAAGVPAGYDFEGNLIGDKAVSVVFDNRKLKSVVPDMKTTVRFDQGVRIALDYMLSHPEECQQEDEEFDRWCDLVIEAQEQAKEKLCQTLQKMEKEQAPRETSDKLYLNNLVRRTYDCQEIIEEYAENVGMGPKDTMHVTLLVEETIGMVCAMVEEFEAELWLEGDRHQCVIHLDAVVRNGEEMKQRAVSDLSRQHGKKDEPEGFMAKISELLQCAYLFDDEEEVPHVLKHAIPEYMLLGMKQGSDGPLKLGKWSLSTYKDMLKKKHGSEKEFEEALNELEKSIVASIADDVTVGIRKNQIRLVITKNLNA